MFWYSYVCHFSLPCRYTPILHLRLRSRPDVQRFVAFLKECGGDEREANRMLADSKKKKETASKAAPTTGEKELSPLVGQQEVSEIFKEFQQDMERAQPLEVDERNAGGNTVI